MMDQKDPRRRGDAEAVDPSGGAAVAGRFFRGFENGGFFFPWKTLGKWWNIIGKPQKV